MTRPNIYIIGASTIDTCERQVLRWLGYEGNQRSKTQVVISEELLDEIARVAKRLQNKDYAGELIDRIWTRLNYELVILEAQALYELETAGIIPREDIGVHLTAKTGSADCFVSANRKLIRALVEQTQEFECMTPEEFVNKHL